MNIMPATKRSSSVGLYLKRPCPCYTTTVVRCRGGTADKSHREPYSRWLLHKRPDSFDKIRQIYYSRPACTWQAAYFGDYFFFTMVVVAEALDPEASSNSFASLVITVPDGVSEFTATQNSITSVLFGPIVPFHSMLFVAAL